MRILIVTETFYPATDGICTRLAQMTPRLQAMGHQVLVVSPDLGIQEYQGVPIKVMDSFTFPLYSSRPWGFPSKKMKKVIENFQPDVIHAVNPFMLGTSAVKYAQSLDIPLLTSYHTHMPNYLDHYNLSFMKPFLWDYLRKWHQPADYNVTVSKTLQAELIDQDICTQAVLPRGIDLDLFHPQNYDEKLYREWTFGLPGQKLLVYVGRLAAEKDLDQLVHIFEGRDDICLAIVGDGPARQDLEAVFKDTKTTFTGFLKGQNLAKAYATGDAFIFPSTSETFGLVISEAMASGTPVIAAESGATLEQIIPGQTGTTFKTGDKTSLQASLSILDHEDILARMKVQARQEAEKYSWQAASQRLLEFYESARIIHQAKHVMRHSSYQLSLGQQFLSLFELNE